MNALAEVFPGLTETDDDLKVVDSRGNLVFRLSASNRIFTQAQFRLPDGRTLFIRRQGETDSVLGQVDTFTLEQSMEPIARVSAIDWFNPEYIPAVDEPAALPSGAGAAILNGLAIISQHRGLGSIRYRGPYPTAGLFGVLGRSFRVLGDRAQNLERFTEGVEQLALEARVTERPTEFIPNPSRWDFQTERLCVETVAGQIRRIYLDGFAYETEGTGPRRLLSDEGGIHRLVLVFGANPWVERMRYSSADGLLGAILPVPPVESVLMGHSLSEAVRRALVSGLLPRAPELLRPSLEVVLMRAPIAWGDAGQEACTLRDGGLVVHAMLGESLRGAEPLVVMNTLAEVIEYPARKLAQSVLAEHYRRAATEG